MVEEGQKKGKLKQQHAFSACGVVNLILLWCRGWQLEWRQHDQRCCSCIWIRGRHRHRF